MQYPHARLLIFAKAPIPGETKTRLIPALGAEGAARVQRRLTERLVEVMLAERLCPVDLWVTPDARDPQFHALKQRHRLSLRVQRGTNLGARMAAAFEDALRRSDSVVLIGTDCPPLTPDLIAQSLEMLQHADAVLGPAEDGGYVLLASQRPGSSLFHEIPWGTEQVAELTRQRMRTLGWTWGELPVLWDLDRPEDLLRAREQYPELLS
jgi:rSAM/selenodomain-associated transferase 1